MAESNKRFRWVCIGLIGAVILLIVAAALDVGKQTPAQTLSLDNLQNRVAYSTMALYQDTCYEFTGDALPELCDFAAWKSAELSFWEDRPKGAGRHCLTLHMGDCYEIAFYEGGYALAFDGYAGFREKDTAWYIAPEGVQLALINYILENGTVRDVYLGADSWFSIDE